MLPTHITTSPCVHCTPFTTEKFSTHEDFIAFEKALEAKCADGTFIRIVNADETEIPSHQTTYQCNFCETDWELSFPEGNIRGYFLPANQVTQQQNSDYFFNMKSGKSSPNCGCCLGMILLLLALIFYIIYSLFSFLFDLIF